MKKLGKLTESWMRAPEQPKRYPLVSDTLFEGKVKRAKKKIKEDDADLPMNKTPEASKMTTNRGPKVDPGTYQTYNSMTDGQLVRREAKDDNWIQGAEKDIERRGTKGKCTPITKPGCTGKAKALAKTFKKMAKKRDAEVTTDKERKDEARGIGGRWDTPSQRYSADRKKDFTPPTPEEVEKAAAKRKAEADKEENPRKVGQIGEAGVQRAKRAANANPSPENVERLKKKEASQQRRAVATASNPDTDLATAVRAGDAIKKKPEGATS